ncbi:PREDICTED: anthocyanidin 3-O-glucosyltransferase 2-like [Ipomoea nil]|uniref:anthocyanidin 3-O-glucosyltransferase 2-like n=1 Tax=Ipomoea nil TaxID=35883 RepID=UPI0009010453|nr:PREDICTED: anthocyanidin 3-O-glucosyltransferase 2-like [Ipomoea nil]
MTMMNEEAMDLVLIPAPIMGHLISDVEMAKRLLQTRHQLSITVLLMKLPLDSHLNSHVESLLANNHCSRLKFISLPEEGLPAPASKNGFTSFTFFVESHKPNVRDCVNEMKNNGVRFGGFVMDWTCMVMMDVADEFGLPTYVYYTSGAAMLGLQLHLQSLRDDHGVDVTEFKDSDPHLNLSTYSKPFPAKLLPLFALDKTGGSGYFLDIAKRMRKAKGILVNTFLELEPHALESLSKNASVPPVYPIGPIVNLKGNSIQESSEKEILKWLDGHPDSSVVFLCFGSCGSFPEPQVKEIAYALEQSGHRFLWSLRRPPSHGSIFPTDYNDPEEALPERFLEKTKSIGKVIGWAPQAAVLAHPAVGGFVSHCGWNSTLESIWFGVPIATWPIYTEQQANAFQLVEEIGIGVEVKMDYRYYFMGEFEILPEKVNAKEIETAITVLMDHPTINPPRMKAKELKGKSREALEEDGSSFNYFKCFFEHVMNNII